MSGIMQRRPITLYETLEALLRPAADTARQELAALAAQWAPEGETT